LLIIDMTTEEQEITCDLPMVLGVKVRFETSPGRNASMYEPAQEMEVHLQSVTVEIGGKDIDIIDDLDIDQRAELESKCAEGAE
jgi:hypothetical protein